MEHLLELEKLYTEKKNNIPTRIEQLINSSASSRKYFRIYGINETTIGVYSSDLKENRAFFNFTKTFRNAGIHVPELYSISEDERYYLVEDLGDLCLMDILKTEGETEKVVQLYKKAIDQLLKMQLYGASHIDFNKYSYPRAEFDGQSVLWDLNYFKYYFLKVSGLTFDEQLLENDFQIIAQGVEKIKWKAFMFRDFQSRNIQVRNNAVWFIDYQGGRKGPMLYDLASILYQASANLSTSLREELKNYYKLALLTIDTFEEQDFEKEFVNMIFIRIIQTLGAYGYRGLIENKSYYISSIPMALENLNNILKNQQFMIEIPYLINLLDQLFQLKSRFVLK